MATKRTTTTKSGLSVKVKRLTANAVLPEKKSEGAACFDIVANETVAIRNLNADDKATRVHTGLAFEIPEGYHMKVFLRSSTGDKTKLRLANQTGIIDSDYRGELMLLIENLGRERVFIAEGQRIAQGMIEKNEEVFFEEVKELSETERGAGGFGSTGKGAK